MVIEIPLSKRGKHAGKYVAIVDDCDADLAKLNWNVFIGKSNNVYAYKNIPMGREIRKTMLIHRIIMERMQDGNPLEKGQEVDHINGNGLDNRRENLRLATSLQNSYNQKKHARNTSGYKGVSRCNGNRKWHAQIQFEGKKIHLGNHDTPEQAHAVYCEKAKELHGEFWNNGE